MFNQQKFSQLKPKPVFNLNWYKGEDLYSDGDVEDQIIDIIMDADPEDYSARIYRNFSWPAFYHLTHLRKNILNWYPFREEGSVLEIGCGLGAITNMLCEKCAHVTAVELSKRRAAAAWLRCRERENLEIIAGNLNDIEFQEKFDYITLIGVLEYQGSYTDSENPFRDFLTRVGQLLKPGGKLLVAIENRFGLKYWCGAREDHTGLPYDGINDYRIGNRNARTFSRSELIRLLEESGLGSHYFYYPMPDYKLPTVVYSRDYLPKSGNMENMHPYYVPDKEALLFVEESVWEDVVQNGAFEFLANSFLVECSKDGRKGSNGDVLFAALSSERKPQYRVGTVIRRDGAVDKFPMDPSGTKHMDLLCENMGGLKERGLFVLPFERTRCSAVRTPRRTAKTLETCLLERYRAGDREGVFRLYDLLMDQIGRSSDPAPAGENILWKAGIEIPEKERNADLGPALKNGYLDMIARNCFMEGGQPVWFDQEWRMDNVPQKFIFYRNLVEIYGAYPRDCEAVSLEEAAVRYGLLEAWQIFSNLSRQLYGQWTDSEHFACAAAFRNVPPSVYTENIRKLISTPAERPVR